MIMTEIEHKEIQKTQVIPACFRSAEAISAVIIRTDNEKICMHSDVDIGFSTYDACCGGLPIGGLTIIEGAEGTGKTALGFQIAGAAAVTGKRRTCTVNLDMNAERAFIRTAVAAARLPVALMNDFETARLNGEDYIKALSDLAASPFEAADIREKTLAEMIELLDKRFVVSPSPELLIIDAPEQLADEEPPTKARLCRTLKHFARRHNCAVLLLMRHDVCYIGGPTPEEKVYADFADVLIRLKRQTHLEYRERYGADLIVPKNRHGQIGELRLSWFPDLLRYEEADFCHPWTRRI